MNKKQRYAKRLTLMDTNYELVRTDRIIRRPFTTFLKSIQ